MRDGFLKRSLLASFLLAFVSSALPAGVDVRLGGGVFGASLPELNAYLRDATRFRYDGLRTAGYVINSSFEEVGGGRDFTVSLAFPIARNLALEVEAGQGKISRRGNAMSLESSFSTLEDTRDLSLSSTPIFLGLDYGYPFGRSLSVHVFASGGLIFSSFKESGEEILTLKSGAKGYTHTWSAEASAAGYGLQAGLGLDVKLGGPFALTLRGGFRHAKVAGFTGKSTTVFNSSAYQDDGLRLSYYEFYANYPEGLYAAISLPNAGQGSRLAVVRDADLGISGLFIGLGLRLSL